MCVSLQAGTLPTGLQEEAVCRDVWGHQMDVSAVGQEFTVRVH